MKKNWFRVKELFPHIWGIGEFEHAEKVISYLFVGKDKALLFDTGMGIGNILVEVKKITKLPLIVLNSHCHPDHIGGNYQFRDIWGVSNEFSLGKAKTGYTKSQVNQYYHAQKGVKAFAYSQFVHGGQTIVIKPFLFHLIASPGHTPDSICLFEQTNQILLTGDTLYPGPIYLFLEESNISSYKKSIEKIVHLPIKMILPGHNAFVCDPVLLKKIYKTLNQHTSCDVSLEVDAKTSLRFTL